MFTRWLVVVVFIYSFILFLENPCEWLLPPSERAQEGKRPQLPRSEGEIKYPGRLDWNCLGGACCVDAFELFSDLSDWGNAVRKIQYPLEGSSL